MSKADLRVDWATHAAAKYACEKWHYSRSVPNQKTVKCGIWECGRFVGVVLFGDGANKSLVAPYGLTAEQGCELVRVAMGSHKTPVTRAVRLSLAFLRKRCPLIRLVVSYADPEQGHHGGIYQAGGWVYAGMTDAADEYLVKGARMHGRALRSTRSTHKRKAVAAANILEWTRKVIDPKATIVPGFSKHRYLMPLDDAMRAQIAPLAKPYPKRAKQAMTGDQPAQRQGSTDPHAPQSSAEC